jgi:hypothetical protein
MLTHPTLNQLRALKLDGGLNRTAATIASCRSGDPSRAFAAFLDPVPLRRNTIDADTSHEAEPR